MEIKVNPKASNLANGSDFSRRFRPHFHPHAPQQRRQGPCLQSLSAPKRSLENCCAGNPCTEGSNPSPSAIAGFCRLLLGLLPTGWQRLGGRARRSGGLRHAPHLHCRPHFVPTGARPSAVVPTETVVAVGQRPSPRMEDTTRLMSWIKPAFSSAVLVTLRATSNRLSRSNSSEATNSSARCDNSTSSLC